MVLTKRIVASWDENALCVNGVNEMHVPPTWRANQKAGCTCRSCDRSGPTIFCYPVVIQIIPEMPPFWFTTECKGHGSSGYCDVKWTKDQHS